MNEKKLKTQTKKIVLSIVILSFIIFLITTSYKGKDLFSFNGDLSEISNPHIKLPSIDVETFKTEEGMSQNEASWQWVKEQEKLYKLTSMEVNLILKEIWNRFPNKDERAEVLAFLRLNTPYQFGCLGEGKGKDSDPVFRLSTTDCTAFILTNTALLHSHTLEEAEEMMKYLNYQPDAEINFENRFHFTTDRNAVSPYFKDATEEFSCDCELETIEVVLNKVKEDGERLIDINWQKKIVIKYIPSRCITKTFLSNLPKVIGIGFIKEGDEDIGLDVRHEGFLFSGRTFFHASSVEKKVVVVDFFEYYFNISGPGPRFDGIILFEIK